MCDKEAVVQAILDYIEGWYEGDPERMSRALHTNLVKRSFDNDKMCELDRETMIRYTKNGGGKNVPRDSYKIEWEILSINNNIAAAVTKSQYNDYLHLVKVEDTWKIINVLWNYNK